MEWVSNSTDKLYLFNKTYIDETMVRAEGTWTGAVIQTTSSKFEIYIGISYVSIKNARLNLETEVALRNFDVIRKQSKEVWAKEFARF